MAPALDPSPQKEKRDKYRTLPDATSTYIQLRFQLFNFRGVYRTVQVPLNYTFANLHTLIQYLFGWNNSHLHEFDVYTHVEMYKDKKKIGHMKKYGHPPDYPDWIYESSDPEREKYFWDMTNSKAAFYHVVMSSSKKRNPGYDFDGDYQERIQEHELTLDMIWNVRKKDNLTDGVCQNTELGIIYQYDLGASWMVHITLDSQEHFFTVDPPSNLPIVVKAAGAPPIEDACGDVPGELEAEDKKINPLLYDSSTFACYCECKVGTSASKAELSVFDGGPV